jgi:hypothetical protein
VQLQQVNQLSQTQNPRNDGPKTEAGAEKDTAGKRKKRNKQVQHGDIKPVKNLQWWKWWKSKQEKRHKRKP